MNDALPNYEKIASRFATKDEVFSADFRRLNSELLRLQSQYNLLDQTELNIERFSWACQITTKPAFYASRMWEYPFAILAADLRQGMKVADIGCGNTPLTAYLAEQLGPQNVYGYDPDVLQENAEGHSHFSAKLSYLEELGIHFFQDNIVALSAADDTFDVVFCISVLEHIDDSIRKARGIKELARVLKPGGNLILTFDLGIDLPLNHIWDIISASGLIPINIDATWPKYRFANYGNECYVDVFGLLLHKPSEYIYRGCDGGEVILPHIANQKMQEKSIFYSFPYWQALAAHDLDSAIGGMKVMLKRYLGRY